MGYRVKTVSALTGIPRGTLLAWERRYAILDPDRGATGYREYTDAEVAVLKRLKTLVDAGYSISEAVEMTRGGEGDTTGETLRVSRVEDGAGSAPVEQLLGALLAFDRAAADRVVPRLGAVPFLTALNELYVPVLRRLGECWERGEITVAQEHFVSGFCREHLLAMYHGLGGGPEAGVTVACATPPGERHELGLLVVAIKLALAGNRVVWLGADLPVPDLCAYLAAQRPRFACLSFTRTASRDSVLAFAKALRAGAPPGTEIVFGGPGLAGMEGPVVEGVRVVEGFTGLEELIGRTGRNAWPASARASG